MSYLSHSAAEEFATSGLDYAEIAMDNLREASAVHLWTHEKKKGRRITFCASMHEDGLGTSRLLLIDQWKREFPGGVRFGIPERSCGIVVPNSTQGLYLRDAEAFIEGCFSDGNTKMLPGLHDPALFAFENDGVDG